MSRETERGVAAANATESVRGETRYRTIVADPPWHIKFGSNRTPSKRGGWAAEKWARETVRDLVYPTMTVAEISALGIGDLADDDAHLYIWTVNAYVRDTYAIAEAWGFRPAQLLTWAKEPMGLGLGGAFTPTTEHVLFCRRGTLRATARMDSTWWKWKRGPHSAKPEAFLDMVEAVSPPPTARGLRPSRPVRLGLRRRRVARHGHDPRPAGTRCYGGGSMTRRARLIGASRSFPNSVSRGGVA